VRICPNCGYELNIEQLYCPVCSKKLGGSGGFLNMPRVFWMTLVGLLFLIGVSLLNFVETWDGAGMNLYGAFYNTDSALLYTLFGFPQNSFVIRIVLTAVSTATVISFTFLILSLVFYRKPLRRALANIGFGLGMFISAACITTLIILNGAIAGSWLTFFSLLYLVISTTFLVMLHVAVKTSASNRVFIVCNAAFMSLVIVIMLYPFINTLALSFNDALDSQRGGIYLWPRIFTLTNFERVFRNQLLVTAFSNSVLRTIISTAGGLFVCSMAAYVLSRREFIWNKFVTIFFLLTMYISAGLIPTYFLFNDLGLINSFAVYWVPGLFGAFNVIVIRTYMQGLPDSLVEAARIDGAGEFRIFGQVILPICKPVLATVGLWIAVGNWNDWFTTFIFAPRARDLTTMQYELMRELAAVMAAQGQASADFSAMQGEADLQTVSPIAIRSAITIVAAVPILCVYPFLQKYFVKGVHVGSVKG